MRHGLDGSKTRTLREVPEALSISQERAWQVEIKARCKQQSYLDQNQNLKGFTL